MRALLTTKKTIRSKSACMVVNGTPRSGKSTIIHRLVRDLFAIVPTLHLPSTLILEKPLRVGIKKLTPRRAAVTSGKASWVEQTAQDEKHRVLRRSLPLAEEAHTQKMATIPAQASRASGETPSPPPTDPPPPTQSADTQSQKLQPTSDQASSQPLSGQATSLPPSGPLLTLPSPVTMPSFLPADEIIRKALTNLGSFKDSEDLDGATMLHILDTGGQPEFQSAATWLLLEPDITVQVFNLSVGLQERYDVLYESQDGQTTEPYKSSFTVEEVLFQAQSSLSFLETSPSPSRLPFEAVPSQKKCLYVGTHLDLVSDEIVTTTDAALQKQLKCSPILNNNVVYYRNPLTSSFNVVIPIDNTKADDPGIVRLQKLVNAILENVPTSELPISWEYFKLSLLSIDAKTMTVQCVVVGRANGLEGKEEVLLVLWYHTHFTGQIQHHDIEGIEDTVWLDPQIISDGISYLISSSFHGKGSFDWKQVVYRETGRFPAAEVRRILEARCREVPYEKIITLFKHLKVISPITNKTGEIVESFVPCVLRPACVERIESGTTSRSKEHERPSS